MEKGTSIPMEKGTHHYLLLFIDCLFAFGVANRLGLLGNLDLFLELCFIIII